MLKNQAMDKMASCYYIPLFDQASQSVASAFEAIEIIKIDKKIKRLYLKVRCI
jgi:hypothetical protein